MIRVIFGAAIVLAAVVFALQPANASDAPWCAVVSMGTGDVYWDCQYRSFEECRPNVLAGNRGWCNPNPYIAASPKPKESRQHRTHRARPQ
ncbi:MAG TPA: DUF3551 domain-containing protein [Pseudolabrys sp.]|jgi:hypothetical protein